MKDADLPELARPRDGWPPRGHAMDELTRKAEKAHAARLKKDMNMKRRKREEAKANKMIGKAQGEA